MRFKNFTSRTVEFTKCFENKKPLLEQIKDWQQVLKSYCQKSFKKIRIRNIRMKPLKEPMNTMINERNKLMKQHSVESDLKLTEINEKIFELEAEENRNKIIKNFKTYSENPETINLQQIWKTLKRMWPKTEACLPLK